MGDGAGLEPGAEQHRCDERCTHPVRCIICNRIKRPLGAVVPAHLTGMRCDDRCPGYLLDPQAGHRWPVFVPHQVEAPAEQLVGTAVGAAGPAVDPVPPGNPLHVPAADDSLDLLAWALHQAHPPVRRRSPVRPRVTYRVACLLMGDDLDEAVARLVRAGCGVRQICVALGSVVLEVTGDPVAIIAELDRWDRGGSFAIVPPPPAEIRTPPPAR